MKRLYINIPILILMMSILIPLKLSGRDAPSIIAGSASTCYGTIAAVPLTVSGFSQITAVSMQLEYNPDLITYNGYENINSNMTGCLVNDVTVSPTLHKVTIVWSDITPLTLSNGSVLLNLKFTLISGIPVISFNNTDNGGEECEFADELGNPMNDSPTENFYTNAVITSINVADAGTLTGSDAVCMEQRGVYYEVPPVANADLYIWTLPSGHIDTSINNNILTDFEIPAVSGNLSVRGHNSCSEGMESFLYVAVNSVYNIREDKEICQGQTYILPDGVTSVNTGGEYTVTLNSVSGCDSIIVTRLTINPVYSRTEDKGICVGSTYSLPGRTIVNMPGIYIDTLATVKGCDSIIITHLTVFPSPVFSAGPDLEVCEGGSIQFVGDTTIQCLTNCNVPTTYCPDSSTLATRGHIKSVQFNTGLNTSGASRYSRFSGFILTDLASGSTYSLRVRDSIVNALQPSQMAYISAYFDWDRNGVFEDSVYLGSHLQPNNTGFVTSASVSVPVNAVPGQSVMRLVYKINSGLYQDVTTMRCRIGATPFSSGEVEDYIINVIQHNSSPVSYLWSGPDGFSASVLSAARNSIHIADSGNYVLTLTTANNCSGHDTAHIKVYPLPAPHITGNDSVCSFETNVLYHIVAQNEHHYYWLATGGVINGNSSDDSVYVNWSGGGNGTLIIFDTNMVTGCHHTDTLIVGIFPLPVANAGIDQEIRGTTIRLDANIPLSGTGVWMIVSGAGGTIVNLTDPQSIFTGQINQDYILRWTVTNGSCSASDDVLIGLRPVSDLIDIGIFQSLTPGRAELRVIPNYNTGSTYLTNIQFTVRWPDNFNLQNVSVPVTPVNDEFLIFPQGTAIHQNGYYYQVFATFNYKTISWITNQEYPVLEFDYSGSCPSFEIASDYWTLHSENQYYIELLGNDFTGGIYNTLVEPHPVVSFTGLSEAYCIDHAPVTLTGNNAGGVFSGHGITDNGDGTASFTPAATGGAGSYNIMFNYSDVNGCTNNITEVIIINALPQVSYIGLESSYCLYRSPDPNAVEVNLTGNYSEGSFSGTGVTDNGNGTAVFRPEATGREGIYNIIYQYTDNNQCSNTSTKSTHILPLPTVSSSPSAVIICEGDSVMITSHMTGTGPWIINFREKAEEITYNTVTNVTINSPDYNYITRPISSGIYEYEITSITDMGIFPHCQSNIPESAIVNILQHPTSEAGPGGNECGYTYELNAVAATIGTGTWTGAGPGNAVFSDVNNPGASVTVDTEGSFTFTWTVVNGSCIEDDHIIVNFFEQPTAEAGNGGNECDLDFKLNASVPIVGSGSWSGTGPGNAEFSDVNDPAAMVSVSDYGTYTFKWTVINGPCTSDDNAVVVFIEQPEAEAGNGGNECDMEFLLNATEPIVGTGTWSNTGPGNVTFSDINDPAAIVNVSTRGTYTFTWTVVNGTCSADDNAVVDFYIMPPAEAGNGGNLCDSAFNLNATAPIIGTGTWTSSGPGNAVFSDANNPTATVTVDTYGAYTFTWTIVLGSCITEDNTSVNFTEQPIAESGYGGSECDLNFSLGATTPLVGTGSWISTGPGTAVFSNINDPVATVNVGNYGSYVFKWTVVNGICIARDSSVVDFSEQPTAEAGNGGNECDLDFSLNATPPIIGTGTWTSAGPGIAVFSGINNPTATVTVDTFGAYTFTWTVVTGSCSSEDNTMVNFYERPIATYSGLDSGYCVNDSPVTITGNHTGGAFSGPGIVDNGNGIAVFTPATAGAGQHHAIVYTYTDIHGCTSVYNKQVDVYDLPVVNFGEFTDLCNAPYILTEGQPAGGVYTGAGVDQGVFYPSRVGLGNYPIQYTYTNTYGCINRSYQTARVGVNIGLYNTECGKFAVKLKPCISLNNLTITNIIFTIKWPQNTVNIIRPETAYGLTQQGNVITHNGYNYIIFASAMNNLVNWVADSEYTVLTFRHDESSQDTTDFILIEDDWTQSHGTDYYVEVLGDDMSGKIYHAANGTFIGDCYVELRARAILQGAYNTLTGMMDNSISISNALPLTQPYNIYPWNYPGTEHLHANNTDIVDWVLVELRDTNKTTVIDRRAGLLLMNGDIVDTTLTHGLYFYNGESNGRYYITILHRNHLSVMTGNMQKLPNVNLYDFSDTLNHRPYGGGSRALIELTGLGTGKFGMIAGDVNNDGKIRFSGSSNDRSPILTKLITLSGQTMITGSVNNVYLNEDLNLNSSIRYSGSKNDPAIILQNLIKMNHTTSITGVFYTSVPSATIYNHKRYDDGSVDLVTQEDANNYYIMLKTNEDINDGLIDNIQFTLSWADNDTETEHLILGYTTEFNLKPQREIYRNNGRKYIIFATVDPKELPSVFASGTSLTILCIPKNRSNTLLKNKVEVMDDLKTTEIGGEYFVSVWGENLSGKITGNITYIDENDNNRILLSYFPNPAKDGVFTLNISSTKEQLLKFAIFSMYGQCVYENNISVKSSEPYIREIFLNKLSKGTYILDVSNTDFKYSGKLIIF